MGTWRNLGVVSPCTHSSLPLPPRCRRISALHYHQAPAAEARSVIITKHGGTSKHPTADSFRVWLRLELHRLFKKGIVWQLYLEACMTVIGCIKCRFQNSNGHGAVSQDLPAPFHSFSLQFSKLNLQGTYCQCIRKNTS